MKLADMNLDPGKEYYAFDFWKQEFMGIVSGSIRCVGLKLGCCQIIGLREVTGVPRLIASSRHVSMDAVSVRTEQWDESQLRLELKLEGVLESAQDYYVAVPERFRWKGRGPAGTEAEIEDGILKINVWFASK